MKTILCLAFIALAAVSTINAADPITEDTANFFLGDWYSVNFVPKSVQPIDCCVPYGKVNFKNTNNKQITISATNWAGWLCYDNYLTLPSSSVSFTVSPTISYSKFVSSKTNIFSNSAIQMSAKSLNLSTIHANSTQNVSFDLVLNYVMSGGDKCSVTLSKAGTPTVTADQAKQAALPAKKTTEADDLSDLDEFEIFDEIFRELSSRYGIRSQFLGNN